MLQHHEISIPVETAFAGPDHAATSLGRIGPAQSIKVAAVVGAPWVTMRADEVSGVEVHAVRRYSEWRGLEVEIVPCGFPEAMRLLQSRRVCIAIGGLADTPALAAAGDRVRYSRRPLCIGGPVNPLRVNHVWGVSTSFGRERRHLEFFLHADQQFRAA